MTYLPAHWVKAINGFCHVFINVESVDNRVNLEGHLVLLAPAADLVEVVEVAFPALSPADQLVGFLIETVTRDGQDV